MRSPHSAIVLSLLTAVQSVSAQARPAWTPTTCASADSVLGPPRNELPSGLGASYNTTTDTTELFAYLGDPSPAEAVHTKIRFKGVGPYVPVGLPLGFTFTGGLAKRIARDSVDHPVTVMLEPDSTALDLGRPFITALNRSGSRPALTVNAIVTRAALLSMVQSKRATVSWSAWRVRLDDRALGVLRGLYRAALCAPTGVTTRGPAP